MPYGPSNFESQKYTFAAECALKILDKLATGLSPLVLLSLVLARGSVVFSALARLLDGFEHIWE